jgi:hypothetical protein
MITKHYKQPIYILGKNKRPRITADAVSRGKSLIFPR